MDKHWSKTEITVLKRNAASSNLDELAQRLNTDVDTVRQKLDELGLVAGGGMQTNEDEVILERYAEGIKLIHNGDWPRGAEIFEEVIEQADGRQIVDRARRHLEICRLRVADDQEGVDPYLQAVFQKNLGDLDEALDLCESEDIEGDERFAYLIASIKALAGDDDEAIEHLATAIRLEPKNRVHAYHDPDLEAIRDRPELAELLAIGDAVSEAS